MEQHIEWQIGRQCGWCARGEGVTAERVWTVHATEEGEFGELVFWFRYDVVLSKQKQKYG